MALNLQPKTLARVKDLPLIAKTVASGFLAGIQDSLARGSGIEFSQYRSYEPGDAPSRIDWKLFGRSDRYFIREAQRQSQITLWLVVDTSASMSLASKPHDDQAGWNKLDYARHLAATLAYLSQQQGDSVGLLGLSSQQLSFLPPGVGQHQWQRLLSQLSGLSAGSVFPDSRLLSRYSGQLCQPGLVFVISDFYQHHNEIVDFIKGISHGRNEVVALQLQTDDEQSFPYRGQIRFQDLESDRHQVVAASAVKADYFNALYQHQEQLSQQLAACGVALTTLNVDQPMDEVLYHYLQRRHKVRV